MLFRALIRSGLFFDGDLLRLTPIGGQLALVGLHLNVVNFTFFQLGGGVLDGGVFLDFCRFEVLFQLLVFSQPVT